MTARGARGARGAGGALPAGGSRRRRATGGGAGAQDGGGAGGARRGADRPPQRAVLHRGQRPRGEGGTGFAVLDEYWYSWGEPPPAHVRFFAEFQRLGGVGGVGYPASRPFELDRFVVQAMQKGVLQWRPEAERAFFLNVFDEQHLRGLDERLYAELQVPRMADWSGDAGRPWGAVVARHLAVLDGYPRLRAQYNSVANPLDLYGLPMSPVVDFGPFSAVRLQRAVLQQYKVATPYARPGDVLVVNGGDVAKDYGLVPGWAMEPQAPRRPAVERERPRAGAHRRRRRGAHLPRRGGRPRLRGPLPLGGARRGRGGPARAPVAGTPSERRAVEGGVEAPQEHGQEQRSGRRVRRRGTARRPACHRGAPSTAGPASRWGRRRGPPSRGRPRSRPAGAPAAPRPGPSPGRSPAPCSRRRRPAPAPWSGPAAPPPRPPGARRRRAAVMPARGNVTRVRATLRATGAARR